MRHRNLSVGHCATITLLLAAMPTLAQPGNARVVGLAVETVGGVPIRGVLDPKTIVVRSGSGEFTINAVALDKHTEVAAQSARSFAQAAARHFGYQSDFSKYNIHIEYDSKYEGHGGVSGAAANALLMVAGLSGQPLRQDAAITGDMTQHGELKAVSGIEMKLSAARASGIRTVIIPAANASDVPQYPIDELCKFQIVAATNMSQVLFHGLDSPGLRRYWQERERAIELFGKQRWVGDDNCVDAMRRIVRAHPEDMSLRQLWEHACATQRTLEKAVSGATQCIATARSEAVNALEAGDIVTALEQIARGEATLRPIADVGQLEHVSGLAEWAGARSRCTTRALEMEPELYRDGDYLGVIRVHLALAALGVTEDIHGDYYTSAQERYVAEQEPMTENLVALHQFSQAAAELEKACAALPTHASLENTKNRIDQLQLRIALGEAESKAAKALEAGDIVTALEEIARGEAVLRAIDDVEQFERISRLADWDAARSRCTTRAREMERELYRDGDYLGVIRAHLALAALGVPDIPRDHYTDAQDRYIAHQEQQTQQLVAQQEFDQASAELQKALAGLPAHESLRKTRESIEQFQLRVGLSEADAAAERGDLREADEVLQRLAGGWGADNARIVESQSRLSLAAREKADALVRDLAFQDAAAYYELSIRHDRTGDAYIREQRELCQAVPAIALTVKAASQSRRASDHADFLRALEPSGIASSLVMAVPQSEAAPLWNLTAAMFLLASGDDEAAAARYAVFVAGDPTAKRPPAIRALRRLIRAVPGSDRRLPGAEALLHIAIAETRLSGGDPRAHVAATLLSAFAGNLPVAQFHLDAIEAQPDSLPQDAISATRIVVLLKQGRVDGALAEANRLLSAGCGPGAMCIAACAVQASQGPMTGREEIALAVAKDPFYKPLTSMVADIDQVFTTLVPLALEEWFGGAEDASPETAMLAADIRSIVSSRWTKPGEE